jgi:hypothetical protein
MFGTRFSDILLRQRERQREISKKEIMLFTQKGRSKYNLIVSIVI